MEERLLKYKNKIGSIAICKTYQTKYFHLYKYITTKTQNFPTSYTFGDKFYCVLNQISSPPLCHCGCLQLLKSPKRKYLCGHSNKSNDVKNKKIQTTRQHYGVDNPSQATQIKLKKEQTCLKNYNVKHPSQSIEIHQKQENTTLKHYGVKNYFQYKNFIQHQKQKWSNTEYKLKRSINTKNGNKKSFYNNLSNRLQNQFIPLFSIGEYQGVNHKYQFKCVKCNNIIVSDLDDGKLPRCIYCNPYITTNGQSNLEYQVFKYISSIYHKTIIVKNRSVLKNQELDIYLPDINIAIEVNGLYWHSVELGKDMYYHLYKTNRCLKQNIQLIHIFEDEWNYQPNNTQLKLQQIINGQVLSTLNKQIIIDKAWENSNIYIKHGYQEISTYLPQPSYFNKNITNPQRQRTYNQNYYTIYDCGKTVLKRT